MRTSRPDVEVAASLAAGDRAQAAKVALRVHGPDVYGFLVSVLAPRSARAAYRRTVETVGVEMAADALAWPLRVWLYAVARRAAVMQAQATGPLSPARMSSRASSQGAMRSAPRRLRRAAAQLRGDLSVDQRVLLVLRIGRGLSWHELALVRFGARPSRALLTSRADTLRGEFRVLRKALKLEAMARGLLPTT